MAQSDEHADIMPVSAADEGFDLDVGVSDESDADARIVMLIDDEPAQSRLISAIAARDGWRIWK